MALSFYYPTFEYLYIWNLIISAIYRRNFKPQIFTDITTPVKQSYSPNTGKVSLITHNQDLFFNIDIVIRRKDMVRVKKKIKALEFQLRKMLELHERSQTTKENSKSKSSIGNVIRRRKGEPDKWISCKLNGSWITTSLFRIVRHIHTFNFHP